MTGLDTLIESSESLLGWYFGVSTYGYSADEDPSVPVLASFLTPENFTTLEISTEKKDVKDLAKQCEEVPITIQKTSKLESLEDLYECIAFSNVTRRVDSIVPKNTSTEGKQFFGQLVKDLGQYNVKETKENEEIAQNFVTFLGKRLNQGCYDLSCGRIKGEGEEKQNDVKLNPACELNALWMEKNQTLNLDNALDCRAAMCSRVKALVKADPDIGGAGVFISYLIQVLLALGVALYIFSKAIRGAAKRRHMEQLPRGSSPQRTVDAHPAFARQLLAFQRLQAWFVASLVVAGSIRNFRHHVSDVDRYLFVAITLNALALLSFSLLTVHHIHPTSSWSTLVISAISYIVCAIFYCIALSKRGNRIARLYENMWTCDEAEDLEGIKLKAIKHFLDTVSNIPKAVYGIVLVFTALVMICILLDNTKKIGGMWHRQSRVVRGVVWGVVGGIYLMILVMQMFIMAPYFNVVDYGEWGFGQLMAISFWLPLIYDYLSERFWEKEEEHKRGEFHDIKQHPEDYEMR